MKAFQFVAIVSTLFAIGSASAATKVEPPGTTVVGHKTPCERNPRICQPGVQQELPTGGSGSAGAGQGGPGAAAGGGENGSAAGKKCDQLRGRLREITEQVASVDRDLQANRDKSLELARQRRQADDDVIRKHEALERARRQADVSEDAEFVRGAGVVARCGRQMKSSRCEQASEAQGRAGGQARTDYSAFVNAKAAVDASADQLQSIVEQAERAQRDQQALLAKKGRLGAERSSVGKQMQSCRAR